MTTVLRAVTDDANELTMSRIRKLARLGLRTVVGVATPR